MNHVVLQMGIPGTQEIIIILLIFVLLFAVFVVPIAAVLFVVFYLRNDDADDADDADGEGAAGAEREPGTRARDAEAEVERRDDRQTATASDNEPE